MDDYHGGFSGEGFEVARTKAVLMGFECWPAVDVKEGPDQGVRWNSGTTWGQWAPNEMVAVISFLSHHGYLVDIHGKLHTV